MENTILHIRFTILNADNDMAWVSVQCIGYRTLRLLPTGSEAVWERRHNSPRNHRPYRSSSGSPPPPPPHSPPPNDSPPQQTITGFPSILLSLPLPLPPSSLFPQPSSPQLQQTLLLPHPHYSPLPLSQLMPLHLPSPPPYLPFSLHHSFPFSTSPSPHPFLPLPWPPCISKQARWPPLPASREAEIH